MNNKAITKRDEDFAKWYTDVVKAAHLANYSAVKGCIVYEANGYAIWEKMQEVLNKKFKETGHQNIYMPMLIPENLLKKETDLINGFAPEVAWVTEGGNKKLDDKMAIRPTSETLFSEYYASVVTSYRDLPKLYNQWCSVLRWEKETRPFLRGREFLWQEGHTIHETKKEAEEETLRMLNIYNDVFQNYLAIPSIIGKKTEKEKFAGAEYTYTVESLMYNGICLQSATSHYFGQKFSKAYDISFTGRNSLTDYAYQTSWGYSTRALGALIMVHSDDCGLVLPPKIAPKQVVIIPIGNDEKISIIANKYMEELNKNGIVTYIDDSDKTPGFKFAEAEVNGIPIRIEIGIRDLNNNEVTLVRRDTKEKIKISLNLDITLEVTKLLDDIQTNLYNRALARRNNMTYTAHSMEEIRNISTNTPGFIKAMWCGDVKCENAIKEINGVKSRCIPFEEENISDTCVVCGNKAKHMVIWGKQY